MIKGEKMYLGLYAIYDSATEMYLPPFTADSDESARRLFVSSVRDNQTIGSNYQDYAVYIVGHYDNTNGVITPETVTLVCTGMNAKKIVLQQADNEAKMIRELQGTQADIDDVLKAQSNKA
jgi:hypothetical protein